MNNRIYPPTAGRPGPRDPYYTPYAVPFCDAIEDPTREVICFVCGSQMGKTDSCLDMIGWRLDTRPRPLLYVGPSQAFVSDQFEPRLLEMLDQAPRLAGKVARGKRMKKTRKVVAGVPIRLAWAGSPTQLSSDQAGDIHVDELDRMGSDVRGEGDPLTIVKARGFTYRDRKILVTSTPKRGTVGTRKERSGLFFWDTADSLESPIWKLWQSGTRHHWAWRCPHCSEWFIPRFDCLVIPKVDVTPAGASKKVERLPSTSVALKTAYLQCPSNGCVIVETDKPAMNASGVYVAPGQSIAADGTVIGEPPDERTLSFWVSGLASPFVSFGERAAAYVEAVESGDPEKIQGVINTGFGELFSPGGGDVPEWEEVASRRNEATYQKGDVPRGVVHLVLTVDVQGNRLVYVIRGWGARATSWLIDWGMLYGPTHEEEVWSDLAQLMAAPSGALPIKLVLIDSGFRPGKPQQLPVNKIYEFCRRFRRQARPTKGSSTPMRVPLVSTKIEVTPKAKTSKFSLELLRLDTDHWKSWVHERVRWPLDQPGAWNLPSDVDDDYAKQIVSEARIKTQSGRPHWLQRSRENHFLDCEAMQAAASHLLGVSRLTPEVADRMARPRRDAVEPEPAAPGADVRPSDWLGGRRKWF